MNYYETLTEQANQVPNSYTSPASEHLDPTLFSGMKLRPAVAKTILSSVINFLGSRYQNPESWTHVWLAGSGVSYRWSAVRNPADLDCLLTINFNLFRQSNVRFSGLSDKEIANQINEELREDLTPNFSNFLGKYGLTFFINTEKNILNMKPYAAYSVTEDRWLVEPSTEPAPQNAEWDRIVNSDKSTANELMNRYAGHLDTILSTSSDVVRRNAEVHMINTLQQGEALFDLIHENRRQAFSSAGEGYADFHNYRWQMGKQHGTIDTLKTLANLSKERKRMLNEETYGIDLPSTDVLIRRAALQNQRNR